MHSLPLFGRTILPVSVPVPVPVAFDVYALWFFLVALWFALVVVLRTARHNYNEYLKTCSIHKNNFRERRKKRISKHWRGGSLLVLCCTFHNKESSPSGPGPTPSRSPQQSNWNEDSILGDVNIIKLGIHIRENVYCMVTYKQHCTVTVLFKIIINNATRRNSPLWRFKDADDKNKTQDNRQQEQSENQKNLGQE